MRVVIQRVQRASVSIEGRVNGAIGKGLMILFAVEDGEGMEDIDWLVAKIANLRIFDDAEGVINLSLLDVDGEALVVSQFTLFAKTKKGNRPSYIASAKPDVAIPIYEAFVAKLSEAIHKPVPTGVFGAYMQVELVNDGPTTIIIDTKRKE